MPNPIRIIHLIPKDRTSAATPAALDVLQRWTENGRAWIEREAGLTFDFEIKRHISTKTLSELAREQLDTRGEGADWATIWTEMSRAGFMAVRPWRIWVVMEGAGEWAGGTWGPGLAADLTKTFGFLLLGDRGLDRHVAGTDPIDPTDDRAYGHEKKHTFGVDSHSPIIWMGDSLSTQQKADLRAHNLGILYQRPATVHSEPSAEAQQMAVAKIFAQIAIHALSGEQAPLLLLQPAHMLIHAAIQESRS